MKIAGAGLKGKVLEFEHDAEDWRLTLGCQSQKSRVPDSPTAPPRRIKPVLVCVSVLSVLLVVAWFGLKAWLMAYLHGPEFARFVNARLSETLHAEVECAPLHFDGFDVFCDGVKARGYEGSPFAEARVEQVRARFSLRRFWQHVWEVEHLKVDRLALKVVGTRLAAPSVPTAKPETRNSKRSAGWLPNRIEVNTVKISDFALEWGDLPAAAGALRGIALEAKPAEGGWSVHGEGGELVAAGLPALDVVSVQVRQRGTELFVNEARFNGRTGGTATATAEIDFEKSLDVRARIDGIDLSPFLDGDWRARLHGKLAGDLRVQSPLPGTGSLTLSGSLRMANGTVEALPVLDQIALFTRTQQYRQLPLTRASGDFRRDAERLEVAKLIAESEGRLRVEGGFIIAQGRIDGSFQVGVPPGSLAWLPGSQEKVFTTARDGYVWTAMRLTGPVDAPREDLSGRLVAAAGNTVMEKATDVTRDAIQTGKEAAKGLFDLVTPLFK